MKVFLNFVPLKAGGGLQIGLDFIENLKAYDGDWIFFLAHTQGTPFDSVLMPTCVKERFAIGDTMASRLFYDFWQGSTLVKQVGADVVYTQFGPALHNVTLPQVNGCAYSNLFYPEVDFWAGENSLKKMFRKAIDAARLSSINRSTVTVFETADLRDRCIKLLEIPVTKATYVLPSVSNLVCRDRRNESVAAKLVQLPDRKFVVYITRYHLNKNLELLIEVASLLKRENRRDFAFLLTLDASDARVARYFQEINDLGLQDYFFNIGPVPSDGCAELYRISHYAVLASNLESFSNNIAESWAMGVPLLVTDRSWAKSLCGDGAHYFEHKNARSLANELMQLDLSNEYCASLVEKGAERLAAFPSSKARFGQYIDIIRSAVV